MSARDPTTTAKSPSSLSADKRFFDEANATFQSDGGWYNTSVPDTAMTTRAEQGSRYQGPDLENDEGDLVAEADAAMDASPVFGSYLDEQVEETEETKEGSFGFPAWETFQSQKDGYALDKRAHLDEVLRGPAARHMNVDEGDYSKASTQGQAAETYSDIHARLSPPSLKDGEGLEETWTDADLKEFRRAGGGKR
ncbi:hypothetical protein BDV11DRAFT_204461 [Aspergillus similis]